MDQLSPQDAQFLYLETPDNLTHLTSVSIFDQSTVPGGEVVRFRDILEHVEAIVEIPDEAAEKIGTVKDAIEFLKAAASE